MTLTEIYLLYIQEQDIKQKQAQIAKVRAEYKKKLESCKTKEEPAKSECLKGAKSISTMLANLAAKLTPAVTTAVSFAQKHDTLLKYAAASSVVATSIVAGVKLYHKFFSKAAKECNDAANKTECMKRSKIRALQRGKSEASKGMSECPNTKDPEACRKKINKHLEKYNKKITSLTT